MRQGIRFVLLLSRQGKVRLAKWYTTYTQKERSKARDPVQAHELGVQCLRAQSVRARGERGLPNSAGLATHGTTLAPATSARSGENAASVLRLQAALDPTGCASADRTAGRRAAGHPGPDAPGAGPRAQALQLPGLPGHQGARRARPAPRTPPTRPPAGPTRLDARRQVVYKRYASLYFVMGVDVADNELITLEVIHHYVEVLDRYFGNVCELDLIFNFHKARAARPKARRSSGQPGVCAAQTPTWRTA